METWQSKNINYSNLGALDERRIPNKMHTLTVICDINITSNERAQLSDEIVAHERYNWGRSDHDT